MLLQKAIIPLSIHCAIRKPGVARFRVAISRLRAASGMATENQLLFLSIPYAIRERTASFGLSML